MSFSRWTKSFLTSELNKNVLFSSQYSKQLYTHRHQWLGCVRATHVDYSYGSRFGDADVRAKWMGSSAGCWRLFEFPKPRTTSSTVRILFFRVKFAKCVFGVMLVPWQAHPLMSMLDHPTKKSISSFFHGILMDSISTLLKCELEALSISFKSKCMQRVSCSEQCSFLGREKPDAAFLQEVVPSSLEMIRRCLPEYDPYVGKVKLHHCTRSNVSSAR